MAMPLDCHGSGCTQLKIVATVSVRTPRGRFPAGRLTSALLPVRDDLAADTAKAFDRAADPVNFKPWPKRKKNYPWAPLQKTMTMRTAALAACKAATINGATISLRIETPEYAQFHIKGTSRMAARRFVGVSLRTRNRLRRRLKRQALKIFTSRKVV